MSLEVQVDGLRGKYDNKIKDESVKYGRNAVENHMTYLEKPLSLDAMKPAPILDFSPNQNAQEKNIEALEEFIEDNDKYLNSLPPLQYEYRYMPNIGTGKVDTKAVLGAAFEEMGGTKKLPVKEFEHRYMSDDMTAEPLDVNKDGNIDIAEYGANIIATDLLSKGTTDISKIDGTINNKGMNAILEYSKISNAAAASKLYSNIYNTFNLGASINEVN